MPQRGWWMLPAVMITAAGLNCTPAPHLPPRADFSPRPVPPFGAGFPTPPLSLPRGVPHSPLDSSPPAFGAALGSHAWKPQVPEREWTSIVIHHTATDHGSVESIHDSHLRKKWLGIGYHFVIGNGSGMADGAIEPTFRWREQLHGAHAGDDEHNQHGIGIALVGNFEERPPSPAQLAAVKGLVSTLRSAYGIPAGRVLGHRDLKATSCPGRYFPLAEVGRDRAGAITLDPLARGVDDRDHTSGATIR